MGDLLPIIEASFYVKASSLHQMEFKALNGARFTALAKGALRQTLSLLDALKTVTASMFHIPGLSSSTATLYLNILPILHTLLSLEDVFATPIISSIDTRDFMYQNGLLPDVKFCPFDFMTALDALGAVLGVYKDHFASFARFDGGSVDGLDMSLSEFALPLANIVPVIEFYAYLFSATNFLHCVLSPKETSRVSASPLLKSASRMDDASSMQRSIPKFSQSSRQTSKDAKKTRGGVYNLFQCLNRASFGHSDVSHKYNDVFAVKCSSTLFANLLACISAATLRPVIGALDQLSMLFSACLYHALCHDSRLLSSRSLLGAFLSPFSTEYLDPAALRRTIQHAVTVLGYLWRLLDDCVFEHLFAGKPGSSDDTCANTRVMLSKMSFLQTLYRGLAESMFTRCDYLSTDILSAIHSWHALLQHVLEERGNSKVIESVKPYTAESEYERESYELFKMLLDKSHFIPLPFDHSSKSSAPPSTKTPVSSPIDQGSGAHGMCSADLSDIPGDDPSTPCRKCGVGANTRISSAKTLVPQGIEPCDNVRDWLESSYFPHSFLPPDSPLRPLCILFGKLTERNFGIFYTYTALGLARINVLAEFALNVLLQAANVCFAQQACSYTELLAILSPSEGHISSSGAENVSHEPETKILKEGVPQFSDYERRFLASLLCKCDQPAEQGFFAGVVDMLRSSEYSKFVDMCERLHASATLQRITETFESNLDNIYNVTQLIRDSFVDAN